MSSKPKQQDTPTEYKDKDIKIPNIYLYYANIMDYFRVIAAMIAFAIAKHHPIMFVVLYWISFILDAFDGTVARARNEKSKLGATLDMVTDRISTAGLLCIISQFYPSISTFFVFMIMLDVGSHWLQTNSSLLKNVHNDNHKNLDEKFWLLNLYYKNRTVLGVFCVGAEVFLLLLYIMHFYEWLYMYILFKLLLWTGCAIYLGKQYISILQILGATDRIVQFDIQEAIDAQTKTK